MTQHLVQHKTSIRFNPRNRGMMTLLLACAMLSSTASWAVDPTVKNCGLVFKKAQLILRLQNNKNCMRKNFQMQKSLGMNFLLAHKF